VQIVPFPQSLKYSRLRQVLRLEQTRPSTQRMPPHIGPVGDPPVHPPPGAHCIPAAQAEPLGHSI
jgi:hypothetical protein